MGWRLIKRYRAWFIVSSMFSEASAGKVGGGCIILKPYRTRARGRIALRKFKRTGRY